MKKYVELTKGTKIGLAISWLLEVAVFVLIIINIIRDFKNSFAEPGMLILHVGQLILVFAIFWYSLFGYRKPNGKMLKILFIVFAAFLAFFGSLAIAGGTRNYYILGELYVFSALALSYVAGRLNKIKQNRIIMIVVGVLLLAGFITRLFLTQHSSISMPGLIPLIVNATLGFAYSARFEERKESGLDDGK